MEKLELGEHAKKSAHCPFHEDQNASFSVWEGERGWHWKCHGACQAQGDEIDLLMRVGECAKGEAIRRYLEMAGCPVQQSSSVATLANLSELSPGTEADWRELAQLRHISHFAPAAAASLGTLRFGRVCGFRCWIITDEGHFCAEARRMDGRPFPAIGPIGERKAHTLKGSVKSRPVGLEVRGFVPADFRALLAVEGGPDYLAALHFTLAAESDCLPVAFLGVGAATRIHEEAQALFFGRRIRFYPHHEANGAGRRAVDRWADQLRPLGCTCDAFDFAGLHRGDGQPVKDLNDMAQLCAEDTFALEGLLP
jgi:hypothetical protein